MPSLTARRSSDKVVDEMDALAEALALTVYTDPTKHTAAAIHTGGGAGTAVGSASVSCGDRPIRTCFPVGGVPVL